jgi:diacylglycerol kinase family enzyme
VLGRRFHVAPNAQCDDGLFDLFAIHQHGLMSNLRSVVAAARIGRSESPYVSRDRTNLLTIHLDRPSAFVGDGELLAVSNSFQISVHRASLSVVSPPARSPDCRTSMIQTDANHQPDSPYPLRNSHGR